MSGGQGYKSNMVFSLCCYCKYKYTRAIKQEFKNENLEQFPPSPLSIKKKKKGKAKN